MSNTDSEVIAVIILSTASYTCNICELEISQFAWPRQRLLRTKNPAYPRACVKALSSV